MDVFLEKFRILRCVRVMATRAVHDGRVDIDVGSLERIRIDIVALAAYPQNRLGEKLFFRRSMRFVTYQTIARCRGMSVLFVHPVF